MDRLGKTAAIGRTAAIEAPEVLAGSENSDKAEIKIPFKRPNLVEVHASMDAVEIV